MRMSHVYQPVMLRLLLGRNGGASVQDIARALLNEDRSQLEYYSEITKNMVGRSHALYSRARLMRSDLGAFGRFGCGEFMRCPYLGAPPSYCVVKGGTSGTLMTGGGFHFPVSASDFGA